MTADNQATTAAASADVTEPVLLTQRHGRVLVVTMNRPRQRNALNAALRRALRETFDAFEQDDELRCAVLAGNGPSFCAGGDLKEMAATQLQAPGEDWMKMVGSNGSPAKPVVAAVQGHAYGGGFLLAQACDLCVCDSTALFGIAEVKRGRGAPWAAPLASMLPKRIMTELLLTGEPLNATRAYELGLANRLVPEGEAITAAVELAALIAGNAPLSVAAAKQLVQFSAEVGQSSALVAAGWLYERVYASNDALEGPRAFRERRDPTWTGT
ncbi:enoyl-CoA hydratase-related protein [Dactylosporangium sp. CA-152071]|uniref:enoyl-CoA hydratase-related protein n=1 Tax=Dactylosporangium sp. CA-152071 TaxID=3239933 RepID=UPI003D8A9B1B